MDATLKGEHVVLAVPDAAPKIDASALFRAHSAFVAAFLRRMGAAPEEIDDLVQDVFLVAHRKGGFSPGEAKPTTWLASIALGELRNLRRKGQRRGRSTRTDAAAVDRAVAGPDASPAHAVERDERVSLVRRALDELAEDKRAVFMLYELEGESCQHIADAFGIPLGTVYSRLHAARKQFAAALEKLRGGTP